MKIIDKIFTGISNFFSAPFRIVRETWEKFWGKCLLVGGLISTMVQKSKDFYDYLAEYVSSNIDKFKTSSIDFSLLSSCSEFFGFLNYIFPVSELIFLLILYLNLLIVCLVVKLIIGIKKAVLF